MDDQWTPEERVCRHTGEWGSDFQPEKFHWTQVSSLQIFQLGRVSTNVLIKRKHSSMMRTARFCGSGGGHGPRGYGLREVWWEGTTPPPCEQTDRHL